VKLNINYANTGNEFIIYVDKSKNNEEKNERKKKNT